MRDLWKSTSQFSLIQQFFFVFLVTLIQQFLNFTFLKKTKIHEQKARFFIKKNKPKSSSFQKYLAQI